MYGIAVYTPSHPPRSPGPVPAVLSPHGGPHTAFTLGWYPSFAYLTALGYAVLAVNFRGSTGYGEAPLMSLPGHIGQHDVDDCMAALEAAVAQGERVPGGGCRTIRQVGGPWLGST
jgi:acylaminoacyl-peptidase